MDTEEIKLPAQRLVPGGPRKEEANVVRRRKYQRGCLYQTGKRRKVWRARFQEPVMRADGTIDRVLRNEFIAEVRHVPSRRDAQALLDDRLRSLNLGSYKPQLAATFKDFVDHNWEKNILPTFRISTVESYRALLHMHLLPHFGGMRLCDLQTGDVQKFVVKKARLGLARNSLKNLRNLLGGILRASNREDIVRGVRLPAEQIPRERKMLTPEQVRLLLRELLVPVRTMVIVSLFTGVRAGELFALQWHHVNFESGVLQVRKSVHKGKFGLPKSRRSIRDLPLGSLLLATLWNHRKRTGGMCDPDDLVFPSRKGTALGRNNLLRRTIYPACDRAGVPRVGWHSLRHLHATLLSETGESPRVAQAQLGHADIETTLSVYTHLVEHSQRRAVERVESLIFPNLSQVAGLETGPAKLIQ